jgi:2-dehydro-3-deoxy-D-gluconate 5-dehydrogenase
MVDLGIFDLTGKKALVTGGSRGLGRAMSMGLANAGAGIAVIGRNFDQSIIDEIRNIGRSAAFYSFDLAEVAGIPELIQKISKEFGPIDILINSAGIQLRHPAADFPPEDWDAVISVNMTAIFRLCQTVGRGMLERGHGKIINIASLLSFQGGLRVPAYAAAKGAVVQFTKSLANEWASRGINVNCIAPGYMDTDMNVALKADPDRFRQILERIPAGRWGNPEDMAGAAVYLASRASDYVSGSVLIVDGGWMGR